jgi:hypothetical protein
MEIDEVRERLKAAEIALSKATKVDQRARAKAMQTGRLALYVYGPEARALAKAGCLAQLLLEDLVVPGRLVGWARGRPGR